MNLFEAISGVGIVGGAAGGAVWGAMEFGFWGAVVGLPVGAVLGWAVLFALPVLLVVGAIAVGVWVKHGRRAATEFLWGRAPEPPDTTSSVG
jgi:hypothetical protein